MSYGAETEMSSASQLFCAGGPDGLIEVWGEWYERDRALKLVVPFDLLDARLLDRLADADGEMPGGEWRRPDLGTSLVIRSRPGLRADHVAAQPAVLSARSHREGRRR